MFHYRDIDRPTVVHIGVQLTPENVIRAVLDGYPAQRAGLRRGDRLLAVDGVPYSTIRQFRPDRQTLSVQRGDRQLQVDVVAVQDSPNAALRHATERSVQIAERDGRKVGYVHLWSGTATEQLTTLSHIVTERLRGVEALVLDLRGGYGGAGFEYLDLFYSDRSTYYDITIIDRDGKEKKIDAGSQQNPNAFLGPLVVLIDEGTRSGKEALAFQFARSDRATVLGTNTRGAFTAGKGVFADRGDVDYLFFMAVAEWRLDGHKLEGKGVAPNREVPYPLDGSIDVDPQRAAGMKLAFEMAEAAS